MSEIVGQIRFAADDERSRRCASVLILTTPGKLTSRTGYDLRRASGEARAYLLPSGATGDRVRLITGSRHDAHYVPVV